MEFFFLTALLIYANILIEVIVLNIKYMNDRKKELGITNKQLCELAGVPIGTLSKIMSGIISNPKLSTMQRIANALNCTLDDFVEDVAKDNNFELTQDEIEIIKAYRSAPHMQEAVKKLLGIE